MEEAQQSLSLISLFMHAALPIKFVMLLLLGASVVSWAMIIRRARAYREAEVQYEQFEHAFWSGIDLGRLFREGNDRAQHGEVGGLESIFRSGFKEFTRLRKQSGVEADAVMEGTQRAMRVALAREEEHLEKHLPFLANVASVSPYIGLFGTVLGIMDSFHGLANMKQATLAVVAPGISEALFATAIGLFAAIPAVIAYNRYTARLNRLLSRYEMFSDEFSSILHRQAHSNARGADE
ncbi:MAG TPA: protein TolQ [Pseudomonadales bacterium]|nr:protein TolQ [Pseudomonadales bacterium]